MATTFDTPLRQSDIDRSIRMALDSLRRELQDSNRGFVTKHDLKAALSDMDRQHHDRRADSIFRAFVAIAIFVAGILIGLAIARSGGAA